MCDVCILTVGPYLGAPERKRHLRHFLYVQIHNLLVSLLPPISLSPLHPLLLHTHAHTHRTKMCVYVLSSKLWLWWSPLNFLFLCLSQCTSVCVYLPTITLYSCIPFVYTHFLHASSSSFSLDLSFSFALLLTHINTQKPSRTHFHFLHS